MSEKYLVRLFHNNRNAVIIDHTLHDAITRARIFDPNGGWENATVEIITKVRSTRTARVLALERG